MAPPNPMPCSVPNCEFVTAAGIPTFELVIKCLDLHIQSNHNNNGREAASQAKTEKPKRPSLNAGMSEADWQFFSHKWGRYVRQAKLNEAQISDELWACMDIELERLAFNDGINSTNQDTLLDEIKKLAVTVLHPSLHIVELHDMKQNDSETTKSFSARVKGVASNCGLQKLCTKRGCLETVSFLDETCYHVVLAGLYDKDMKEKVLTQAMLGTVKDLTTLLNYTAAEESAKAKSSSQEVNAIQKQKYSQPIIRKCKWCGSTQHGEFNSKRQSECKAYNKKCSKCNKDHHFASMCRSSKLKPSPSVQATATEEVVEQDPTVSGFIATLNAAPAIISPDSAIPVVAQLRSKSKYVVNTLPVPHHIYDEQLQIWKKKPPKPSPTITVSIALDKKAYKSLQLAPPELVKKPGAGYARARKGTADTGAQLTVMNVQELQALGIKKNTIFPLATTVNTVTKSSIDLIGGVFLTFTAADPATKYTRTTHQLCYVSQSVKGIYLSEDACIALRCVPSSFPMVGECSAMQGAPQPSKCQNDGIGEENGCCCPKRSLPPTDAPQLPCQPTKENLPELKKYILDRYASSAFNCCEKQPLPLMTTAPPLRLFVDEQATPVAAMTPSAVPLHWSTAVKAGLDRDVQLGVLEKVPVNEPVQWCSRMVITAKSDGSPRRVIDYGSVNRNAPRQVHHTRSPHAIAMSVPPQQVKTVLDNWHGYHSVPIHEPDRHLTTFITPYGRYRYKTVPQGFISAGDGYTQRLDLIVEGIKKYDHCVDDSILWDDDINENFFRVCDFLEKCSKAGCIFNPLKFQFAEEEVEFIGFTITSSGIKPTKKFIKTIMDFPEPASLTDVRAWFGVINQVSYAFAMAPHMAPFRHLLSSKVPFYWSDELGEAFRKSKMEIIRQCEIGVRTFKLNAPTALATDWSKQSVGCWLTQKVCSCDAVLPGCCNLGWQTVYVASKFNSPAVSEYHPIEGEAFAATWALEKCRFFVLGHPNLKLVVDHKPLLAILGGRQELADLINPRLLGLKLKTMAYRFEPIYLPGKLHVVPDTMSRRRDSPIASLPKKPKDPPPVNNVDPLYATTFGPPNWVAQPVQVNAVESMVDEFEALYLGKTIAKLASLSSSVATVKSMTPVVTWETLSEASSNCPLYVKLREAVKNGFPLNSDQWSPELKPYIKVHKELTTLGPVVMLHQRPVIPEKLRTSILQHLHSSHSGVSAMMQRAITDVYWPGFKSDIVQHREKCMSCNQNAPSNPTMPLMPDPAMPSYPFQVVCADFFTVGSKSYLAMVDKYSNWLSVLQLTKDTSAQLIKALRQYFMTVGICEELCTDGAKVFTSDEMKQFCKLWGVKQRISSAYHPQSNKRAEVAVKSAKRLVRDNLTPAGDLNTDRFARALLMHRNTPDPEAKVSPAEIVYGHPLRDPIPRTSYTPRKDWQSLAAKREEAFLKRHYAKADKVAPNKKELPPLKPGDYVYVQDQVSPSPKRWSKSGQVLESLPYDSFLIKLDGSNKVTKRNRQYLRRFQPFHSPESDDQPVSKPSHKAEPDQTSNHDVSAIILGLYEQLDTPLQTFSCA